MKRLFSIVFALVTIFSLLAACAPATTPAAVSQGSWVTNDTHCDDYMLTINVANSVHTKSINATLR